MNGIEIGFECKNCKKKQTQQISGTTLYRINGNKDIEYIPIECKNCRKSHFIASNGTIVKSFAEEDIEKAYDKKIKELGGTNHYDKNREYLEGKLKFITEDEYLITIDEVKQLVDKGSVMY